LANDALALDEIDAFYGDSHVLHSVSFHLGEGRLLGLLGRNGAGKSTSMNVTVGLLPPRRGAVKVYGRAVTGRTPEAIAALGVALVPQGRRVFRSLTVRENLAVAGRKPQGDLPMLWTLDSVSELFPRLRERGKQIAGSLSGGEQQMLAIGRALMSNPRVLLMDEPSEGTGAPDRRRGDVHDSPPQGTGALDRPGRAERQARVRRGRRHRRAEQRTCRGRGLGRPAHAGWPRPAPAPGHILIGP
jgi:branched-chain amino acid transport system ATP-binding protein